MITKFNQYITESLRDKMVGKSKEEIISSYEDEDKDTNEMFLKACKYGDIELLKYSLNTDINVDRHIDRGLEYAFENGHVNIIKYLREIKPEIEIDFKDHIRIALFKWEEEILNYILQEVTLSEEEIGNYIGSLKASQLKFKKYNIYNNIDKSIDFLIKLKNEQDNDN